MEIEKGLVNKNLEIYKELEVDVDFGLSAFIINSKYIELRNEYGETVLSRDSESPNNITVNELAELTDDVILIEQSTMDINRIIYRGLALKNDGTAEPFKIKSIKMLVTEDESITHIYSFHDENSGKLVWKKSESKDICLSVKGDMVQVERGNVATDWIPAPEDIDNNIDKLEGKIVNVTKFVNLPADFKAYIVHLEDRWYSAVRMDNGQKIYLPTENTTVMSDYEYEEVKEKPKQYSLDELDGKKVLILKLDSMTCQEFATLYTKEYRVEIRDCSDSDLNDRPLFLGACNKEYGGDLFLVLED